MMSIFDRTVAQRGMRAVKAKRGRGWLAESCIIGLAALYTLLNAVKPLHMDDTAYCYDARQIASHPFDPYGGTVFWYDRPDPASEILAPPVLPYWWGAAIWLFGERPLLWKLWLFPFALLFVWAMWGLFRRFARGLELPLLAMTILSPVFLPSLNLMLDVPALALALGAILLFMRACGKSSWKLAVAAGLVAGLAMETKYTGFLAPVTMLLYALSGARGRSELRLGPCRRLVLWLVAAGLAGVLFTACESLIAIRYGSSHFLAHLRDNEEALWQRLVNCAAPLLSLTGALGPAVLMLGLVALRWSWTKLALAGAIVLAIYASVAAIKGTLQVYLGLDPDFFVASRWTGSISTEQAVFSLLGTALWAVLGVLALRVTGPSPMAGFERARWRWRPIPWFLVTWLALEVAGYFTLSPFLAARRVMGVVTTATLLAGWVASRTARRPGRRTLVWLVAALGVILGLGFYAIDLHEAQARKQAVVDAEKFIRGRSSEGVIWFAGHWGFQFYAERLGMRPAAAEESHLQAGDWLLIPDDSVHHQDLTLAARKVHEEYVVSEFDPLPLKTVWSFYGTALGIPLEHHEGARVRVTIYRVIGDFVP